MSKLTIARVKDFNLDFWEQNPEIVFMSPFNSLKKKKNGSKVMMGIYLMFDSKSSFRRSGMDDSEIIKDVSKNFMGDEKFPWDEYQDCIDAYKDKLRSVVRKKLDNLLFEISEMEQARRDLSFDDESERTTKIKYFDTFEQYYTKAVELQKQLDDEVEGDLSIYGDYMPSMIEEYAFEK
jgi:hypothetical protein